jgi:pyridoxamine 5'-phosphate oxidase family protein
MGEAASSSTLRMSREEYPIMSVFTENELAYLRDQRLGRLATVRPDGSPQIAPVGFRYNAELDVIEIGGRFMSKTRKYRNVLTNPHVSLVIDDVLPPWQPRAVEIRGIAHTLSTGGKDLFGRAGYAVDDAIIRITPVQIVGWGLDQEAGWSRNRVVERE